MATATYPDSLPRRTAHAVHALMAAGSIAYGNGPGPFTAAEVCVYDSWEALSPRHTAAALREAQKLGLAMFVPPSYWTPTNAALALRGAFEERFLRDTVEEAGG